MPKRARTEQAKDERRQRLLDAALEEFYEKGFSATRMEDIAARVGLSKGSLYLYFDSKEALLNGLVETISIPKVELLQEIAGTQESLRGLLTELSKLATEFIKNSKLPRMMKIIIGESNTFPELTSGYRQRVLDKLHMAIEASVKAAINRMEINQVDSKMLTRLIIAPVLYAAIWETVFAPYDEHELEVGALLDLHHDLMFSGLEAKNIIAGSTDRATHAD